MTRNGPGRNRGTSAVAAKATASKVTTGPEREVADRVHAAAVVLDALDSGDWDAEVELLDALADVVAAASRWAMVAEVQSW